MGLIAETAAVFEFLEEVYACFPVAVRLLILGAFGGVIYIAVIKSIRR